MDDLLTERYIDLSSKSTFRQDPILFLDTKYGKFPVLWAHYASWHSIVLNASSCVLEYPLEERGRKAICKRREMYSLLRLCLQLIENVEDDFHSNSF